MDGNFISEWLNNMNGVDWAIIGAVLLVLEVVTGTTYILWPALAAFCVAVLAFMGIVPEWTVQFMIFFLASAALLIVGHKYVRPKLGQDEPSDTNERGRSMVGLRVRAVGSFKTGEGRVQVGDTQWRARIHSGDPKNGDELRVTEVKGTTLIVEPYVP